MAFTSFARTFLCIMVCSFASMCTWYVYKLWNCVILSSALFRRRNNIYLQLLTCVTCDIMCFILLSLSISLFLLLVLRARLCHTFKPFLRFTKEYYHEYHWTHLHFAHIEISILDPITCSWDPSFISIVPLKMLLVNRQNETRNINSLEITKCEKKT